MFPFSRKPAKPTRTSNEDFPLCPFCQPLNRLEAALVEKYEGRMDLVRFLNVLLPSEVYLVTREDQVDVTDEGFKLKPSPILFTQELRGLHHLAVFTHVERGGVVPRINPEFSSSLPVRFLDLFAFFERNPIGVILNPFFEKNMSWDAGQLEEIGKGINWKLAKPGG